MHSRGCSFVQKARHVEGAGGKAVLIADNAEDNDSQYLDMITDGSTAKPSIPALFLLGRDGWDIKTVIQTCLFYISINTIHFGTLMNFPFSCIPGWWSEDLFKDRHCRGLSFPFLSMFPLWPRSRSSSPRGHCGRNDTHPQLNALPQSITTLSSVQILSRILTAKFIGGTNSQALVVIQ